VKHVAKKTVDPKKIEKCIEYYEKNHTTPGRKETIDGWKIGDFYACVVAGRVNKKTTEDVKAIFGISPTSDS
jgi:hypothetical protein